MTRKNFFFENTKSAKKTLGNSAILSYLLFGKIIDVAESGVDWLLFPRKVLFPDSLLKYKISNLI